MKTAKTKKTEKATKTMKTTKTTETTKITKTTKTRKTRKTRKTNTKKRVRYRDVRAVSHSCDVFRYIHFMLVNNKIGTNILA